MHFRFKYFTMKYIYYAYIIDYFNINYQRKLFEMLINFSFFDALLKVCYKVLNLLFQNYI